VKVERNKANLHRIRELLYLTNQTLWYSTLRIKTHKPSLGRVPCDVSDGCGSIIEFHHIPWGFLERSMSKDKFQGQHSPKKKE